MECTYCGAPITAKANVCSYCGRHIAISVESEAVASTPATKAMDDQCGRAIAIGMVIISIVFVVAMRLAV